MPRMKENALKCFRTPVLGASNTPESSFRAPKECFVSRLTKLQFSADDYIKNLVDLVLTEENIPQNMFQLLEELAFSIV